MSNHLEDQIRGYTEALYASASRIDELAPPIADGPVTDRGTLQVTVEPERRSSIRGPLAAIAAALIILVAVVPILILNRGNDPRSSATNIGQPDVGAANPFVGSWESFDDLPGDTSRVAMDLTAAGTVALRDEAATGCERNGYGFVPAHYTGTAMYDLTSEPKTFTAAGDLYCETDNGDVLLVEGLTISAEYHPVRDVLISTTQNRPCWTRTTTGDRTACP